MKEIGCRGTSPCELLLSTSRLSRNDSANEIANKIQCIEGTKMSSSTDHKSWGWVEWNTPLIGIAQVEQVRQRFASFAAAARLGKFSVSETELSFSVCVKLCKLFGEYTKKFLFCLLSVVKLFQI